MPEQESLTKIVRQLRSGQITIPADFRRRLGIGQNALLRMTVSDGELRIRPVQATETASGAVWFQRLYDAFAPARNEAEQEHLGEAEIHTAIDEALTAVRRTHA